MVLFLLLLSLVWEDGVWEGSGCLISQNGREKERMCLQAAVVFYRALVRLADVVLLSFVCSVGVGVCCSLEVPSQLDLACRSSMRPNTTYEYVDVSVGSSIERLTT